MNGIIHRCKVWRFIVNWCLDLGTLMHMVSFVSWHQSYPICWIHQGNGSASGTSATFGFLLCNQHYQHCQGCEAIGCTQADAPVQVFCHGRVHQRHGLPLCAWHEPFACLDPKLREIYHGCSAGWHAIWTVKTHSAIKYHIWSPWRFIRNDHSQTTQFGISLAYPGHENHRSSHNPPRKKQLWIGPQMFCGLKPKYSDIFTIWYSGTLISYSKFTFLQYASLFSVYR